MIAFIWKRRDLHRVNANGCILHIHISGIRPGQLKPVKKNPLTFNHQLALFRDSMQFNQLYIYLFYPNRASYSLQRGTVIGQSSSTGIKRRQSISKKLSVWSSLTEDTSPAMTSPHPGFGVNWW